MTEICNERSTFGQMALALDGLTIYKNLRNDPVIRSLQRLLSALSQESGFGELYRSYHEFCSLAAESRWPDYLTGLLLEDENIFSKAAAKMGPEGFHSPLKELVERDLSILQKLGELKPGRLKAAAKRLYPEFQAAENGYLAPDTWPEWEAPLEGTDTPIPNRSETADNTWWESLRQEARRQLSGAFLATESARFLAAYHRQAGYGSLSKYLAFRWLGRANNSGPRLTGIENPEPFLREQLIGLERELGIISENTEHFLAGFPANNMLLYGKRGTGKSSAVKSLLSSYSRCGLRLVELAKEDLGDFRQVAGMLRDKPLKFIIFVDDLSFEDSEPEYKALKSLLEGSLEARPSNVLIYATSNRRHLIRENFSDRQGDEVHAKDTVEEKLSLADRFGITVTFPSPDQAGYLKIVEGLAAQRALPVEKEELQRLALRWEMMHNGRSGRTARQFIDYYEASIAVPGRG